MVQSQNGKRINTCNGLVSVSDLGVTLIHEHVIVNPNNSDKKYDQYRLIDKEKALKDLQDIRECNCNTICDLTPINFGRDVKLLQELSILSDIHILATTGYHKEEFLPDYIKDKTVEELAEIIIDEIDNGIDETDIKPALIKCGSSYNTITKLEEKCFEAACIAHLKTGIPITTHCDKGTVGLKQVELFQKYNINLKHVILGHIDMNEDEEYIDRLLETGVNIEFDHIGRTLEHDEFVIRMIEKAIDTQQIHQIILSQDMGKKDYLLSYSGKPGLYYIFKNFKNMFEKKIDKRILEQILVDNVIRFFE